MTFVSNHDKNAWEGTEYEQFGDALDVAIVLSVVGEGIPLVYNGQEAGNEKRLEFFAKDLITWRSDPQGDLYRRLFALKKAHPALWNGASGGRMVRVPNDREEAVLSFFREMDGDQVLGVFNLSAEEVTVSLTEHPLGSSAVDALSGDLVDLSGSLTVPAWGYRVVTSR
jgi:glycosidase